MAKDSEDTLRFGDFNSDERERLFGPRSKGVEFVRRVKTRNRERQKVQETVSVDGDREPASACVSVESPDGEDKGVSLKRDGSDEKDDAASSAPKQRTDAKTSNEKLQSMCRAAEMESEASDVSVCSVVNTDSTLSSKSACITALDDADTPDSHGQSKVVENAIELQPPVAENKTVVTQAKTKPNSWAALFVNTPTKHVATGSKTSQLPVAPHSVNYVSTSQVDTKVSPDFSPEAKVVSIDEDLLASTLADKLSKWEVSYKAVPLIPRGLINKGNLCYINATMQSLLCCSPFYNLLMSFDCKSVVDRRVSSTPVIDTLVRFANEFEHGCPLPVKRARKGIPHDLKQGSAFEPMYIYSMLHRIKSQLSLRGRQEDAEEFLSCMLDSLHEEMLKLKAVVNCSKADNQAVEEPPLESKVDRDSQEHSDDDDEDEWEEVGPKNKSSVTRSTGFESTPISQIYGGLLRSSVQMQGSKESVTLEPFFTLKLDIQEEGVWSVRDALEGLSSKEALHGFMSSKTGQEVDASKRLALAQLPPILILHLKRFLYNKQGGCQKIGKEIDYTADMELNREFLAEGIRKKVTMSQRSYKLFSVVYHHGKHATGGHYTCDVYHHSVGGWLRFDDSLVKMVSEQQVLKHIPGRVAYLLYYKRCDLS